MLNFASNPTNSAWLEDLGSASNHELFKLKTEQLPQDTDVVIVGAGLTGIFTAYWLSKLTNFEVIVLEGRCIAGGATGRNGGHLWSFNASEEATAQEMVDIITELQIECELEQMGSISIKPDETSYPNDITTIELDHDELLQSMGLQSITHGRLFPTARRLWPAKLMRGIAERLVSEHAHIHIYEGIQVNDINSNDERGCTISSTKGTIYCKHVIIATNGWTTNLLPELQSWLYPCRNEVICTNPLPRVWSHGLGYGSGANEIYAIQRSDGRIIIGGARSQVPDLEIGNWDDSTLDGRPRMKLLEFLQECFPLEDVTVQRGWSGIMGFTRDGMPLVGPVPGKSHAWVAAGYNGHGMPRACRAARAIVKMIIGELSVDEVLEQEQIMEWSSLRLLLLSDSNNINTNEITTSES